MSAEKKQTILIVGGSKRSRAILADMLADEYEILEAENSLQGTELLRQQGTGISLVLLDDDMPEMDGFGLLKVMGEHHWLASIPAVIISARADSAFLEQAYALGAADVVSQPFHQLIFRHRIANLMKLYAMQKQLSSLAAEQTHENGPRGSAQDKEIPL